MNKELSILEKNGLYLFHGSGRKVRKLIPRQAYNWKNDGIKIKDGKPAVYASNFFQISTFMALINKKNCPKGYYSGFVLTTKGKIKFSATKQTLRQLKKSTKGYVYIFNKKNFKKIRLGEWVSYQTATPLKIIEVGIDDLPKNIKIIVSSMVG